MTPHEGLPALLFDLDGTLVDSVPDISAALNATLGEDYRRQLNDRDVATMVGKGVRHLVERAYAATGTVPHDGALDSTVARFSAHYRQAPIARTRLHDGVLATVKHLSGHGYAMAVCTNKPQAPAEVVLAKLGLAPFFPVVFGGGSVSTLKPDPEMLRAALIALDHQGPAVMIGDSPNDTIAAKAAGLATICVTFGYRSCSLDALGADILIDRFSDLPKALDTLRARW